MSPKPLRPQAIWSQLMERAKARGEDPSFTLLRYASERLLYRLSLSEARDRFVLKGAMLFAAWTEHAHRSTKDVDLLCFGDPAELASTFRRVCAMPVEPEDGVHFEPDHLRVEETREDEEYEGRRVLLKGTLGKIHLSVQVDVGFGDAVTPEPVELVYPALLAQLPAPKLRAYPPETVVAEKFEAMVKLGLANSRMKDFFDVWSLSQLYAFSLPVLSEASFKTFSRRKTTWPVADPIALTEEFSSDSAKQAQWRAFLVRTRAGERPSLEQVVRRLQAFLGKLYRIEPEERHLVWDVEAATWKPASQ